MTLSGLLITLSHSLPILIAGLALFSSGLFVSQSAATVQTGKVADRSRSAAAGIYVTFYYIGGSAGAAVPAWFWIKAGWPTCVALFAVVSLLTLLLGFIAGSRLATSSPA